MASEIYPVTMAGRVLGFFLMLYAVGVFSYFIASIRTVLVEADARQTYEAEHRGSFRLSEKELDVLRSILERAEKR